MKFKISCLAFLAFGLMACDENTGSLGISADIDQVSNTTCNFPVYTNSILLNEGIIANNSNCFLGQMTDPETGCTVSADFAAQFQTFENNGFPNKKDMVDATDTLDIKYGVPVCDSCEVRLFFKSYYGEGNNPMKLDVFELSSDPKHMLSEDSIYYTDVDLTQFLPENATPLASRMFTAEDYDVDEEDREDDSYNQNLHIMLPPEFGQRIMDKYYADPSSFKDSYNFTHKVLPGLYFRCSNGTGTLLKVYVGTLNIYFKYHETKSDTIYDAMTRFAATPEVIQSSRFQNSSNLSNLIQNDVDYTILKTPAGIATEMTLPINDIFKGEHAIDSISKATVTLTRYNRNQSITQLDIPKELLMVRKTQMKDFFTKRSVSNSRTSYTTSFASTYNTYTFNNISRLLSYCMHEKLDAVRKRLEEKGHKSYTTEQFAAEEALWEAENPDWNKVLIIPVVTSSTSVDTGGSSSKLEVTVNHDMGLNSIRLVGGTTPIQMQVVYSRFRQ